MSYFGVRSVVLHGPATFEERIVIIAADDEDEAIAAAANESREYCSYLTDCSPLGLYQSYLIGEEAIQDKSEVFSLMRTSQLAVNDYLSRFYDDGSELQRRE